MSLVRNLFCSSLGKKYIMALTGLALIGFAAGHLVGNLQVFSHPDKINGYAHFLQGLGPMLWVVRLSLLTIAVLHVWAAIQLTLENAKARPGDYGYKHTIQATLASRTMRLTGFVVAAFIVYHILHFTVGAVSSDTFKTNPAIGEYTMAHDFHLFGLTIVGAGAHVHDVHTMMVLGFQKPIVALFYIVAVSLLSFHLWHGFESAFQSLGLRTSRWGCFLKGVTRLFVVFYLLGSIAIPGAVLAGVVKAHGANAPVASTSAH
ncbi:MAG TPA: succinate dehydrogenase cytochrome b subunit [Opitutaceae bacterium]|nr:succinate dehydrogenase cytochrome b subunit [Opitutaceae bacterium]